MDELITESPEEDLIEIPTPDGVIYLPTYVPTVEETIKASGGHRQGTFETAL